MAVYPLHTEGRSLVPQDSSYSEEYASRMCRWYLTDHIYRDEDGRVSSNYRLHSNKHRSFADFMQYDVMCVPSVTTTVSVPSRTLSTRTTWCFMPALSATRNKEDNL